MIILSNSLLSIQGNENKSVQENCKINHFCSKTKRKKLLLWTKYLSNVFSISYSVLKAKHKVSTEPHLGTVVYTHYLLCYTSRNISD